MGPLVQPDPKVLSACPHCGKHMGKGRHMHIQACAKKHEARP